jgi:thioredoxin reductase (NADPH)
MNYDVVVVGAGPAGLSAAIELKKKNISVLVVEKGTIVNSIQNFPTNMTFFSTVELLEIGGVPFVASSIHPTRVEAVNYYSRVAKFFDLQFKFHSRVLSIVRSQNGSTAFTLELKDEVSSRLSFVTANRVIVSTGFYDNPNLLSVPGENLPIVSHYYKEPGIHFKQRIVVVGGNNSAVEAALDLYRHGAEVMILHRGERFGKGVKYWVLPDIENRMRNGEIAVQFNSRILEILPGSVIAEVNGAKKEFDCDFVYALTGYHPAVNFLRELGIEVDERSGVPKHDPETFESNVSGIYLAGSIVAGYDCNKVFIENGREHGKAIARSLN